MKQKIIYGFGGGIILSFAGFVVGLFIGMNIGGNYYPEFEFMGNTGYEATGYLGGLIGAIIGLLLGVYLGLRFQNKVKQEKGL